MNVCMYVCMLDQRLTCPSQTTPNLAWSNKYSVRRHGLKLTQVRMYGRQVLEGVLYLHSMGLSPLGQIQSGNVYVFNNRCR